MRTESRTSDSSRSQRRFDSVAAAAAPRLTGGVVASVVLHAGFVAGFFVLRSSAPPPSPPLYRVQLFAAPPGERAIGVVQEAPVTPPPPVPEVVTPPKSVPVRPKLAPPKVKAKPAPKAATPVEQAAPVRNQDSAANGGWWFNRRAGDRCRQRQHRRDRLSVPRLCAWRRQRDHSRVPVDSNDLYGRSSIRHPARRLGRSGEHQIGDVIGQLLVR